MRLYEINAAIEACVDTETGEIIDEAALDALQIERQEKIRNICAWIVDLDAEAKAAKERADEFTRRKKAAESKADSLRRYLSNNLNGQKWKDNDFSVSFRKTQATEIYDEAKIPVDYLITQQPKIDRAGLLRTLKMGTEIPGARLVERQSITVK